MWLGQEQSGAQILPKTLRGASRDDTVFPTFHASPEVIGSGTNGLNTAHFFLGTGNCTVNASGGRLICQDLGGPIPAGLRAGTVQHNGSSDDVSGVAGRVGVANANARYPLRHGGCKDAERVQQVHDQPAKLGKRQLNAHAARRLANAASPHERRWRQAAQPTDRLCQATQHFSNKTG